MKTLVVYRSHYGSTRRYAQWLAQALDADAAEERQADARLVQNYECVIFGGGLYAGSIAGAARMAKLYCRGNVWQCLQWGCRTRATRKM